MKILHIINNLGSGGAEKLIEETVSIINKDKGINIDVLLLSDNKNVFDKKLKENGVKVDVIPLRKPYNPINIYYIRKYIIEGKYDIVHSHLFPTIYWVSIASKLMFKRKIKFVMTEHSTHNRRRERIYLRYLEKFIYSSYDKIISISQQTQNNLISWLRPKKTKLDRFIIIENGIDLDKFKNAIPYKKPEICNEFTEDTKLLCMVGRFSKAKDQSTLIKAMKNLPENVHLLLLGEGPLKEKNQNLAKKIGASDRVHFLGFRDDVERILKTVDIVVLSSNWEGFGLAAVEGMVSGKLVIASNVGGVREVIRDDELMTEVSNYDDLSNKIRIFLKDKSLYNEKISYLINRSEKFDISVMINNYLELYYTLIKR